MIDFTKTITQRLDGTYEVTYNGLPYHVIETDALFAEVEDWATAHPELLFFEQPPEPPTLKQIQKNLTYNVQEFMNSKVQEKNYDDIFTACTYATSTDEVFAAEGQVCVAWRDNVWRKCYQILDEVLAGERELPTVDELIAELPELVWPS